MMPIGGALHAGVEVGQPGKCVHTALHGCEDRFTVESGATEVRQARTERRECRDASPKSSPALSHSLSFSLSLSLCLSLCACPVQSKLDAGTRQAHALPCRIENSHPQPPSTSHQCMLTLAARDRPANWSGVRGASDQSQAQARLRRAKRPQREHAAPGIARRFRWAPRDSVHRRPPKAQHYVRSSSAARWLW